MQLEHHLRLARPADRRVARHQADLVGVRQAQGNLRAAPGRQQVENGAQIIDVNMDEGMLDSEAAMVTASVPMKPLPPPITITSNASITPRV